MGAAEGKVDKSFLGLSISRRNETAFLSEGFAASSVLSACLAF